MSEDHTHDGKKSGRRSATPAMVIEVQVRQPRSDCPIYTWDRQRECMRVTDIYHAKPGLPADLTSFHIEGQMEFPLLLLSTSSFPPGTLVQARLLGALCHPSLHNKERALPADGWVFVAVAEVDASLAAYHSIDMLPAAQVAAMKAYVQTQAWDELQQTAGEIVSYDAEAAARSIRETRVLLKREQRMRSKEKGWLRRDEEEEKPVAWRAIEGLSEALRAQLLRDKALQADPTAPHAQAEHLIRFVPQRFQHALSNILLDDERLLAFVERPLLRHRTGWLGMQTWRSNEGLFLITDRQVLWLRDFLTPGGSFLPGGYIAHMAPLERLQGIVLLPSGKVSGEFAGRFELHDSPYQRLVMEVASSTGSELFAVEFPDKEEIAKVLARMISILCAFLPSPNGTDDRRVRRLPVVEAWEPHGAEAEQLAMLGGTVPPAIAEQLESRLSHLLKTTGEELLISAVVPALEDYKSSARLVALTRRTLLVLKDAHGTARRSWGERASQTEHEYRYDLTTISSAQLRQSLLGSSLSIFVPQPDGHTQQHVFPFHSPAIARFLPLFTRLRLLLGAP
ncbi:MAG: hypothetical protein IVW55_07560 [Chloroflexi bacterium]|nr:hypothetical protein [Chloroflexota bacterium]